MGDVVVFGGDHQLVATRLEIDRVQACIGAARALLQQQLELPDFLHLPLKRIALALEAGAILDRLASLQQACVISAEEYFAGEVQSAANFDRLEFAALPAIAGTLAAFSGQWGPYKNTDASAEPTGPPNRVFSVNTLAGLLTRLERTAAAGEPEVRIEKFSSAFGAGGPGTAGNRYVVYIPGTQAWLPMAGKNPLDLTSNLQAMAGPGKSGSEAAVQRALRKAGVGARDQVLLVGHSQGGMVAANIASQPQKYKVAGVVTFGSPISQLNQELRVPTISLQHSNDLVPKLDLKQNALAPEWVTIERQVSTPDDSKPDALEAHELKGYRGTAILADQNTTPALARIREVITGFAEGTGEVTNYRISR